jgi:hypothetical protein
MLGSIILALRCLWFSNLPIGAYEVTVAAPSFRDYRQTGLRIDDKPALTVDAIIGDGHADTSRRSRKLLVHIEMQNTQMGGHPREHDDKIPLNGRSFTDLLSLQPGVAPYSKVAEGENAGVSGSLNPGKQSVNGQREASNGFMVNGANETARTMGNCCKVNSATSYRTLIRVVRR